MGNKDVQDKVVLGIHSAVGPDQGNSAGRFMDGHAWLSLTANGKTQYYGLWPDGHPLVEDNGSRSDIRTGLEAKYRASASRYYELSPDQLQTFQSEVMKNVAWTPTTTCAGWASDTVKDVTGHRLEATELLIIQTPRKLIEEIRALEKQQPTSPHSPAVPADQKSSSISLFSASGDGQMEIPAGLVRLHEQGLAAIQRLNASGRIHAEADQRLALSATHLAAINGLERIDHVVISDQKGVAGTSGNLFVVQGPLNDPAHHRASMPLAEALGTTLEQALDKLNAVTFEKPQHQEAASLEQSQRMQIG